MSTSMRDLISGEAELDDEEDDGSFDEETGEGGNRPRVHVEDSSEEDDDEDEDEEEAQKIREGFIVDEDDEDVEQDGSDEESGRRARMKRKREHRKREEEDDVLDEDDLDLIGEQFGERPKPQTQSKFKRLKRGRGDEDVATERRGLAEIFSDDDDEAGEQRPYRPFRAQADEFDDFIEEDFPEDQAEVERQREDAEVAGPRDRGMASVLDTTGLDKDALEDMEEIFGNGEDYAWALQLEDEEEDREREAQTYELKDVFEPSQIKEKLLTDEDNQIRFTDEPERFQVERKAFKDLTLTPEQFKEEGRWISNQLWPKKGLAPELQPHFGRAVSKILEFFLIDEVEVPFVFQHRRDYLLHERQVRNDRREPGEPEFITKDEKLLNHDDLWRILELDIKFRSFVEKRNALGRTLESLRVVDVTDETVEEMIPEAATMEELQDLQDYLHFQYGSQLKDVAAVSGNGARAKRPGSKSTLFDRTRASKASAFVKAYGITADQLAKNALRQGKKVAPDDDAQYPMDLADGLIDDSLNTGDQVISAARALYVEELFSSPRLRKFFRNSYYQAAEISCKRTEKGLRKIDDMHPYYEIKYLQNQAIADLVHQPELFLKMMRAEEEGLVNIILDMPRRYDFRRNLYQEFESENFSDRAEQWRAERKKVLDAAFPKLEKVISKNVKEVIRTFCQDEVLKACRQELHKKLDQAPYKPKGWALGTIPQVLVLSNGGGDAGREPIHWVWVETDGRVIEQGKFVNLSRDEAQREEFVALVERRKPDIIGVSGWTESTHKLVKDLEGIVSERRLMGPSFEDLDSDDYRSELLEVMIVEDEVARLYKDSQRAKAEHPSLSSLTRYCIALGRYMQNPLKEYAALGKDIASLSYHPCQNLLPAERLMKYLETALVDVVNLCGVTISEAMTDPYVANLLPYVAGLGPRKASSFIKAINANGGSVTSRDELVGDPDSGKLPVVGPKVWNNCSSFLIIEFETGNRASDPLDSTRVHSEDYSLASKIAADALELDEEDIQAEKDMNGSSAVVRKFFKEDGQDKIGELVLEEYAEQLWHLHKQRKRATLENISQELQAPYEELRRNFAQLSVSEVFTIFSGETKSTLCEGMLVPVNVRVVKDDFAIVKLDCGIEGRVESHEVSTRAPLREVLSVGQTLRAKILEVDYQGFSTRLTMREESLRIPYKRVLNYSQSDWDYDLERSDKDDMREKNQKTGRTQRVVKHPNFKPFNSTEAEQFLGSQPVGEVLIRPSSKGNDHLAVTWKVADNVYQHIDVLEMQKENEFSVGKVLRIGKYQYSDLDEMIVDHVKATARKVEELMRHDKFQNRSRSETDKWLTTYIDANPNRSAYAFCIDTKHPGYFWLCFKASRNARVIGVPVKAIPQGFEFKDYKYPDMRALCNGFKLRFQNEFSKMGTR